MKLWFHSCTKVTLRPHFTEFCERDQSDCSRTSIEEEINYFERLESVSLLNMKTSDDQLLGTAESLLSKTFSRYTLAHRNITTLSNNAQFIDKEFRIFFVTMSGGKSNGRKFRILTQSTWTPELYFTVARNGILRFLRTLLGFFWRLYVLRGQNRPIFSCKEESHETLADSRKRKKKPTDEEDKNIYRMRILIGKQISAFHT